VGLVVPAGYSFNLDGTCIYLTCAALFLAQATDTPMTLAQQIGLLLVMLITSKGAAGITGSGFIVLAATLETTGKIPVAALAIIFGIDRFMSEIRTLTNFIGNTVGTLVIARWRRGFGRIEGRGHPAEEASFRLARRGPSGRSRSVGAGERQLERRRAGAVQQQVPSIELEPAVRHCSRREI
jgi:aerobic C4-dicarboxylate transport protein